MRCFPGFHDWQVQRTSVYFLQNSYKLRLTREEANACRRLGLGDEIEMDYSFDTIYLDKLVEDKICRKCEKIVLQVDDALRTWMEKTQAKKQAEDKLAKADAERSHRLDYYKVLRKVVKETGL